MDFLSIDDRRSHIEVAAPQRTEYPIDSHVLIEYPPSRMNLKAPTKFHTPLKGPLKVKRYEKDEYELLDLTTNKTEMCNIKRMRPFNYDPNRTDPRDVAMRDNQFHDIEAILKHRGPIQRKSEMQFLVKWEGYDNSKNTWEPWGGPKGTGVRKNIVLHQYLIDNKMKHLIPKEFRK